ncbi:hypothetical protein K438DRAFT_1935124 [Mycena galopus ATCC 62051]|nr:hypothetical protein K438DRAFT_1935124 [Mycena galopus ATCC 62051]
MPLQLATITVFGCRPFRSSLESNEEPAVLSQIAPEHSLWVRTLPLQVFLTKEFNKAKEVAAVSGSLCTADDRDGNPPGPPRPTGPRAPLPLEERLNAAGFVLKVKERMRVHEQRITSRRANQYSAWSCDRRDSIPFRLRHRRTGTGTGIGVKRAKKRKNRNETETDAIPRTRKKTRRIATRASHSPGTNRNKIKQTGGCMRMLIAIVTHVQSRTVSASAAEAQTHTTGDSCVHPERNNGRTHRRTKRNESR